LHIASSNGFEIGPIFPEPYFVPPMVHTPVGPPAVGVPGSAPAGGVAVLPPVDGAAVPVPDDGAVAPDPELGALPPDAVGSKTVFDVSPAVNVPRAMSHVVFVNDISIPFALPLPYFVPLMVHVPVAPPVGNAAPPPGSVADAFAVAGSPSAIAAERPSAMRVIFMENLLMKRIH
jgi:hypothetical protein